MSDATTMDDWLRSRMPRSGIFPTAQPDEPPPDVRHPNFGAGPVDTPRQAGPRGMAPAAPQQSSDAAWFTEAMEDAFYRKRTSRA